MGKDTTSIHCIQSASYNALFLFRHSKSVINIHTNNKIWLIEAFSNLGYLGGEKKERKKRKGVSGMFLATQFKQPRTTGHMDSDK